MGLPGRVLTGAHRSFLSEARRAVLVTAGSAGELRPVPICFAVAPPPADALWTPLDEKPKRSADPRSLARVRDILARPTVGILVDRWDEDWSRLAWLRLEGQATLLEPGEGAAGMGNAGPGDPGEGRGLGAHAPAGALGAPDVNQAAVAEHAEAVAALRARYPQYDRQALERRPIIRVTLTRAVDWGSLET